MNNIRINIVDRNYGCFSAYARCSNCHAKLHSQEFSFERHGIGIGDKEKIAECLKQAMKNSEIFYCHKCGNKL
jgi:exosome complex RNA-binding protein Csl4